MPYKKGPNHTLRYYSSTTGKYCFDPSLFITQKHKKTAKEKEEIKQQMVYEMALKSKDKHLFEVYSLLEKYNPGIVRNVNCLVYDKSIGKQREIDIITKRAIIEIKSGSARHKEKQYLAQMKLAKYLNKTQVVYSPKSTSYQVKCMRSKGINIYNSLDDFIEKEVKKKC